MDLVLLVHFAVRQWMNRPYILLQLVAPVINALLIVWFSVLTLIVRWSSSQSVWHLSPLPFLLLLDWTLFVLQSGHAAPRALNCHSSQAHVTPPRASHEHVHMCGECELVACSTQIRHCPACGRCVWQRHHHCFMLGSCVSTCCNMAHFLAFCLHASIGCVVTSYNLAVHVHTRHLAVTTLYGAVNTLLPPVTLVSWVAGQVTWHVPLLVTSLYVSVTTAVGTCGLFVYLCVVVAADATHQHWPSVTSLQVSDNVSLHFRHVFGARGAWHLLAPWWRVPPHQTTTSDASLTDVKIL